MSSFLFATVPAAGHTLPALPIAQALIDRGHRVRWYGGAAYADRITAVGASFLPMSDHDYSRDGLDGFFPERRHQRGVRKLQFDMVHGFAEPTRTQVRDLRAVLDAEDADLVVGDTGFIGGPLLAELGGPPVATFGISVVGFPSRDLPPFGLGLQPGGGPLGRILNTTFSWFTRHVLFRPMTHKVNEIRAELGLGPTSETVFEYPARSALYLQLGAEGFEYPRSDLPVNVRYVGPPSPLTDPDWTEPGWWPEVLGSRPVVLLNQGTVATDSEELLRPGVAGLASEDVLVIAVTGGGDPSQLGPLPANARAERYVPFDRLLPHVDVLVTNGGYGGVQLALAAGVPIVAAGRTEDKLEVNARVAYSGVGLDLRTQTPSPQQLRAAVDDVLGNPRFGRRARELRDEIQAAGREQAAAGLLEDLAAAGARPRLESLPDAA